MHRGNLHRDRPGIKAKLTILSDKLGRLRNITMVYGRTVPSVLTVKKPDRKNWLALFLKHWDRARERELPASHRATKCFSHQQANLCVRRYLSRVCFMLGFERDVEDSEWERLVP